MEDIDMSRPGTELFPDQAPTTYNSYLDEAVGDPLNTGFKATPDEAGQGQSDKERNFEALREVTARFKEEKEYWKGQAEALTRLHNQPPEPTKQDAMSALDWDDGKDVQKAFDSLRQENQLLRNEMRDALSAVQTKTQYNDWNNMVTQHVPQLTSKNPIFAEMIQKASNPYEAAYLLAELNARATQPGPQQPPPYGNGQRAIANASKPRTLESVGGASSLSGADYYAQMSDEDFMKVAARNLANI